MKNCYQYEVSSYKLPDNVYRRTIYTIKDYEAIKTQVEYFIHNDVEMTDYMNYAKCFEKYTAIMEAMKLIPREYRDGVFFNIIDDVDYPDFAHLNTWKKWKQIYVYYVAKFMGDVI